MDKKLSTSELRRQNRINVYNYFRNSNGCAKQDIATALKLSLPTVTQNLTDLMSAGLINYVGLEESNGGRRARTMAVVANAKIAIGVEITPKQLKFVALNLLAQEIAHDKIEFAFLNDGTYSKRLAQAIEDFIKKFSINSNNLLGIGITIPGIVNNANKTITQSSLLHLNKIKQSILTSEIPYPVHMENDATAAVYAEWSNHHNHKNIAYLYLGKGVGGAIMINDKNYLGENYRSAEFGHIKIIPNGKICSCGQRGCLQSYCSSSCISDELNIKSETFFAEINNGNEYYIQLWNKYLDNLAKGIDTINLVMDCDVILGGNVAPYVDKYLNILIKKVKALNSFDDDIGIYISKCGFKGSCIGAALYFIDNFIENLNV